MWVWGTCPAAPGQVEVSEKRSAWTCGSFLRQPCPTTQHAPSLLHFVWKVGTELGERVVGCERDGMPGKPASRNPDVVEVREQSWQVRTAEMGLGSLHFL